MSALTIAQERRPSARGSISFAAETHTVGRRIRVLNPDSSSSISTILSNRRPPRWIQNVMTKIQERDVEGVLSDRTVIRLAEFLAAVPASIPQPYIAVGDDETVGVEWDFPRYHVELQFGNDRHADEGLLEALDGSLSEEFTLEGNRAKFAILLRLAARP
jgi:hypothetical protein